MLTDKVEPQLIKRNKKANIMIDLNMIVSGW